VLTCKNVEHDMTPRERQRRAEQRRQASYTINQWCERRQVSRAMFYKLEAQGLAPRTHNAGKKRLISEQSDADWVREREAASAHDAA
jgi:hypothetical protein